MLNTDAFTNKHGQYRFAASNGIADQTLLNVAAEYRASVSRKYLPLTRKQAAQTLSGSHPTHCSVKYDGEQVFVLFDSAKNLCVAFNSPSGRCRIGLPYLEALRNHLTSKGIKKALLVGESYLSGSSNQRTRVSDVIHATFRGSAEHQQKLTLAIYDIVMLDGKDYRTPQKGFLANWESLKHLLAELPAGPVHLAESNVLPACEALSFFDLKTNAGQEEGIVVRDMQSPHIYKLKPELTVDTVIVGFAEGEMEGRYGVTSLLCGLFDLTNQRIIVLGRVGSGFTDEGRSQLLDTLSPRKVPSPLNMTDSSGRPITFVEPGTVVEIGGENLVAETTQSQNQTQILTYDQNARSYQFHGLFNFPTLTHLRYLRLRPDKVWNDGGTRPEQLVGSEQLKGLTSAAPQVSGAPEVIDRLVYVKNSPKGQSVRKGLIIQTNSPSKFPFVVHWTDFSPGRKVPLDTSVEVAQNKERAAALLQARIASEIKKGWEKV